MVILTPFKLEPSGGGKHVFALATPEHIKFGAAGETMEGLLQRWKKDCPECVIAPVDPIRLAGKPLHQLITDAHLHWHTHAGRHAAVQDIVDNHAEYCNQFREDQPVGDSGEAPHSKRSTGRVKADKKGENGADDDT